MFKTLSNRHLGMDIVRSVAVLSVLVGHALIFLPKFFNVQWLLYLAVFGVEIFFALSGFLIGNILIKMSLQQFGFKEVIRFWIKRWMRTIPVYLVIVVLITLFNKQLFFSYLIFTQNYYPDALNKFPVSWSLTIEEWFYLSFPLLMFIFSKILIFFKLSIKPRLIPISIIIFITVPFMLRFLAIEGTENWDNTIRKQIHLRLDGIAYGVLLAYLYNINKQWFKNKHASSLLGVLLILGFVFIWWLFETTINIFTAQPSFFNNVIFYPLINIYAALFVAYFIRFQTYSTAIIQRIIMFVSLISYSLYLVHYPIYIGFAKYTDSISMALTALLLSLICIFISGFILYMGIEKPFIDLRNKWIVSKGHSAL